MSVVIERGTVLNLPKNAIITIDGLAASGKSSVARNVARLLSVPYVSSGLLYRLVTLAALEDGVKTTDERALLDTLDAHELRLEPRNDGNRVYLDDRDVTEECASSRVDAEVSHVAQHGLVRSWVNAQVRRLAPPFVAEGRDMGTAVFPHARAKIYLTASSKVRAARRVTERNETLEVVRSSIEERDELDADNSEPAPDAAKLHTDGLNLDQTVKRVLELIREQVK
jgi:CMP/dCMP kinase